MTTVEINTAWLRQDISDSLHDTLGALCSREEIVQAAAAIFVLMDRASAGPAEPDPDVEAYRYLADHIVAQLNPPETDEAEEAILAKAVTLCQEYIDGQPCTCPPGADTMDADPCLRCAAIGRECDRPVER